jgi:hypothetical protein
MGIGWRSLDNRIEHCLQTKCIEHSLCRITAVFPYMSIEYPHTAHLSHSLVTAKRPYEVQNLWRVVWDRCLRE